ncbi:DASH family cryptochrome [Arcticibacter tournemirensis]|uniref:Cryptochrome DASH n=2 Tax=Arcticibacter tournemirensis TaxID=699437 RepID=A0A4Q0M6H8_9SPHI|nr:DASH family cryptochrome [Arcticibacter tournemirensis]
MICFFSYIASFTALIDMSEKTILIWFRNDLRIHDNEILIEAVKRAGKVIPVYCFDPRYFKKTAFGANKTGAFRARFLFESVINLRESLRSLGGDLVVKKGKPEEVLPDICHLYNVKEVYHHREVAPEETNISAKVEAALWKQHINLKHFIGHTLYHKEDLPFPIKNIPDDFSVFRKKIERDSTVRPCFDTPGLVKVPDAIRNESLPDLSFLGIDADPEDDHITIEVKGGESEGIKKLKDFLLGAGLLGNKGSRSLSPKLSPWLSAGCLSPREVYWEVKKYQKQMPDLAARMIVELQWRDYFRFMLKKHGSIIPQKEETRKALSSKEKTKFEGWKSGVTGEPLTDACMRKLNATGYISDICKQYAGTFLVKTLKVPWMAGSAYYEEKAIDFSPANNLGTWATILGSRILSSNKNIIVKFEEVAQEDDIKKWFSEYNNAS